MAQFRDKRARRGAIKLHPLTERDALEQQDPGQHQEEEKSKRKNYKKASPKWKLLFFGSIDGRLCGVR